MSFFWVRGAFASLVQNGGTDAFTGGLMGSVFSLV